MWRFPKIEGKRPDYLPFELNFIGSIGSAGFTTIYFLDCLKEISHGTR
jgi:hypothetical protein